MEDFKREHFMRDHPETRLPFTRVLSDKESTEIRSKIRARLKFSSDASSLQLAERVFEHSTILADVNPTDADFSLRDLLTKLNIAADTTVFVSWFRYEKIDEFKLSELSRYFSDIWYPGADDVEIFDLSCTWVLIVLHYGAVRLAVLPSDGG